MNPKPRPPARVWMLCLYRSWGVTYCEHFLSLQEARTEAREIEYRTGEMPELHSYILATAKPRGRK